MQNISCDIEHLVPNMVFNFTSLFCHEDYQELSTVAHTTESTTTVTPTTDSPSTITTAAPMTTYMVTSRESTTVTGTTTLTEAASTTTITGEASTTTTLTGEAATTTTLTGEAATTTNTYMDHSVQTNTTTSYDIVTVIDYTYISPEGSTNASVDDIKHSSHTEAEVSGTTSSLTRGHCVNHLFSRGHCVNHLFFLVLSSMSVHICICVPPHLSPEGTV